MNSQLELGVSNIAWPEELDQAVLDCLQKSGVTLLDISPSRTFGPGPWHRPDEIQRYLSGISTRAMRVIAFQSLLYTRPDLNIFSVGHHQELIEHFRAIFDLAAACRAEFLIFGSPRNRMRHGMPLEPSFDLFRKLGDMARPYHVSICIEPSARQYGSDFLNTTKDTAEFVQIVGHPNIRLHLDLGNMLMEGEDWEAMIQQHAGMSPHFHLSAPHLRPLDRIDKMTLTSVLKTISRFYGHYSVEMLTEGTAAERLSQISKCLEFVAKCRANQ